MASFTTPLNQVEQLYVGYFGRAGDAAGMNYWIGQLNSGAITLARMSASFAVQPEATSKYPFLANPNLGDPGAFVDQVYQNLFNHAADVAGKAYWVAQLTAASGNSQAIGQFILNVISGATGADDTTIRNKVDVGSDFTSKTSAAGTTYNASVAAQSSAELASVNDTPASVTAAKAATDAYIATAPGPQSNFTLAIDTLTSSSANANFNSAPIFNPGNGLLTQSLQTGDSAIDTAPLTGAGFTNGGTFTALLNGAAAPLVTLKGIPTHTVTATAASGYSGDIAGLVNFNNNGSTAAVTIGLQGQGIDKGGVAGTTTTGATLLSTVNLNNVVGAASSTTILVNTAALAGAADSLGINVVGPLGTGTAIGTANTVSVKNDTAVVATAMNGYETLKIAAAAATNIALADATSGVASTTTVSVAGAGLVTLWGEGTENHFTKLTTIDASTQTGGVTVTGANSVGGFASGAVLTSFKGGTGIDSLDISSMTAAQVQAITAGNLDGSGARDTLILGSNAGGTGAANTIVALNNSNFETIGITALGGTIDHTKFGAGVDTYLLSSGQTAAAIFNNLSSGVTVGLGVNSGAFAETFNSAGTSLTDSLTVSHTGAAGGSLGALTYTGFETINENLTLGATPAAVTIASITASASVGANVSLTFNDASTSSLTITGTTNVGVGGTLNVSGAGTGGVVFTGALTAGALNASGLAIAATATGVTLSAAPTGQISELGSSGIDVLRGSTVADSISGGAGADMIDAGKGGDVWSGGAGADTFGGLTTANDIGLQGEGVAASASGLTATVAAGQTITFANGTIGSSNVDRIIDFVSGTDKLDVVNAGVAPTSLLGADATANFATNNVTYVLYGNYAAGTGVFTAAAGYSAATSDAIIENGSGNVVNASTGWVLLTGLNQALVSTDFV